MLAAACGRRDESRLRAVDPTRYDYGPDPSQFGELYLPRSGGPFPVIVVIHGGFWRSAYDLSLGTPLAEDLAGRGYAAWNLEYRRLGNGGGWPTTLQDVADGIDLLAVLAADGSPVDVSRVATLGHSAGGTWRSGRPPARVSRRRPRSGPCCAAVRSAGAGRRTRPARCCR
ncbi:MAG: alpha/beta hydrolase [Geodermatophilaceae bacterium]